MYDCELKWIVWWGCLGTRQTSLIIQMIILWTPPQWNKGTDFVINTGIDINCSTGDSWGKMFFMNFVMLLLHKRETWKSTREEGRGPWCAIYDCIIYLEFNLKLTKNVEVPRESDRIFGFSIPTATFWYKHCFGSSAVPLFLTASKPHVYTSLRVRDNINHSFRRHHLQLTLQAIKNWRGGKDLGKRLWYTFVSTYFTYLCPKDTDLHDYATHQPFLKQPSISSFPGPSPASFPSLAVRLSVLQANGAGLGSGNEAKLNRTARDGKLG